MNPLMVRGPFFPPSVWMGDLPRSQYLRLGPTKVEFANLSLGVGGVGECWEQVGGFHNFRLCFSAESWSLAEFCRLSSVEVTPLVLQLVTLLIHIYRQPSK